MRRTQVLIVGMAVAGFLERRERRMVCVDEAPPIRPSDISFKAVPVEPYDYRRERDYPTLRETIRRKGKK